MGKVVSSRTGRWQVRRVAMLSKKLRTGDPDAAFRLVGFPRRQPVSRIRLTKFWHSIDPGLRNLFRIFPDRIPVDLQDREISKASAKTMFYYRILVSLPLGLEKELLGKVPTGRGPHSVCQLPLVNRRQGG
jgi:hypothetical protein